MKKLNIEKISKKVDKIKLQLKKDNLYLTTKGLVHLIINLIEGQK